MHLRGGKPKIKKIENLHFTPNLRHLNLSYNAIVTIEGLEKLGNLIELNMAENSIENVSYLIKRLFKNLFAFLDCRSSSIERFAAIEFVRKSNTKNTIIHLKLGKPRSTSIEQKRSKYKS